MSAAAPSPVEATPSPVSNSGKGMRPTAKLGLIAVGLVFGLGVAFIPGGSRTRADKTTAQNDERPGDVGQRFQPWGDPARVASEQGQGAAASTSGAQPQGDLAKALLGALSGQGGRIRRVAPASIVAYAAPRETASAGTGTASRGAAVAGGTDPAAVPGGEGGSSRAAAGTGGGRGGTDTIAGMQVLRAARLPQPQFWLMPGDKLFCDQNEPIVGVEGAPFTCNLTGDVQGRTGHVTLLSKGARLVGTVVRGVDNGEERLGVSFNHAEDAPPAGEDPIVVPLNSPGADATGQAGLDGHVNTHFWSKLGATSAYALLDLATQGLSIGAGAALGGAFGGSRNTSVNVLNLGSQGRSLAQSEWGEQANRRPTFERNKGEPLTVFITHPIWFGDAVALRLRGDAR
jgi:hypothetical protein